MIQPLGRVGSEGSTRPSTAGRTKAVARGDMNSKTCRPPIAGHTEATTRGGMGSKTCRSPSFHTAYRHAKNLYRWMEAHVWPH